MQEAGVSFLSTWQNFYVLIGSAAATLTGLMFVVATLIAGVRVRVSEPGEAFATFNTPNVVHFCLALLVAAILSAPWQALWNAGLLLGLLGLGGMIYVVIVLRRARRQRDYQPVLEEKIGYGIRSFRWSPTLPSSSRRCCSQAIRHQHCSSSPRERCCSCSSASTTRGIT